MHAVRTPWKQAFRTFDIDFGYKSEPHLFRPLTSVLRRQNSASSSSSFDHQAITVITTVITMSKSSTAMMTVTSLQTADLTNAVPTITIPTASPTATSLTIDLAHQELNSTFSLPIEQIQK